MSDMQIRQSRWFDEQGQPRFNTSPQAQKPAKSKQDDSRRYGLADLAELVAQGAFVCED